MYGAPDELWFWTSTYLAAVARLLVLGGKRTDTVRPECCDGVQVPAVLRLVFLLRYAAQSGALRCSDQDGCRDAQNIRTDEVKIRGISGPCHAGVRRRHESMLTE